MPNNSCACSVPSIIRPSGAGPLSLSSMSHCDFDAVTHMLVLLRTHHNSQQVEVERCTQASAAPAATAGGDCHSSNFVPAEILKSPLLQLRGCCQKLLTNSVSCVPGRLS